MRLERLESVSLRGNYFNKSIISCISFLPSLNILDFSGSFRHGSSFPMQELSSLKELTTLDLRGSGLKSLTLNGSMSNLLHLNLEGNEFSDDIMRSMAAFPSLIYLSLDYCSLGGRLFGNGTKLSNLVHLSLVEIEFNGDFMRSMVAFPSLRFLDLGYAGITGRLFGNVVPSIPNLQVLILNENHFSGPIPIEGRWHGAFHHAVTPPSAMAWRGGHEESTGMKGREVWPLVSFHRLEILDLSGNNFVGSIPSTIKFLSSLKALSFSFNSLNGSLTNGKLCRTKLFQFSFYITFAH
ncbi:putative non-specific serine/threonine protein kinase [Helianthus annuus]|nr:putative non-specific serine/threonine protein kinase [Helianthus annuus]